ncbi:hypothetical protein J4430_01300 [Candidatus Woesearchaeota archaeon]|nr:hypothetical protein [Candidatus Woesearchaeota archaeon]
MKEFIFYIVIGFILTMVTIETLKHHILRKVIRSVVLLIIIIAIFIGMSGYLIESKLLKTDNKWVISGAAIFEKAKNLNKKDFIDFNLQPEKFINKLEVDVANGRR